MTRKHTWLALSLLVLTPALAAAQATSSALAVFGAFPGMDLDISIDDASSTEKWVRYQLRAGRSYCAEVGASRTQAQDIDENGWGVTTVYQGDATTVIGTNTTTSQEPDAWRGSRVCFVMPGTLGATVDAFVRVTDSIAGTLTYRMRLVETTMWASWFFIGGDYNSFLLLRNTTSETVSYTVRWRNAAGTSVGSTSGTVPANGGLGINARTFIGDPITNFNGTVEITHTGSPEALQGQVTSLSSTTGLGFDSTLFQRKPWQ